MWMSIGKWALKVAVYCYGHPDQVKAALSVVKAKRS